MYGIWKLFSISNVILIHFNIVACQFSLLVLHKRKLKYVENCHFSGDNYIVSVQCNYFIWLRSPVTSQQVATHKAIHHLNSVCLIRESLKFANCCVEFLWLYAEYGCNRKRVNLDKSSLICLFKTGQHCTNTAEVNEQQQILSWAVRGCYRKRVNSDKNSLIRLF